MQYKLSLRALWDQHSGTNTAIQNEPIFCFELAMKALYWSGLAYDKTNKVRLSSIIQPSVLDVNQDRNQISADLEQYTPLSFALQDACKNTRLAGAMSAASIKGEVMLSGSRSSALGCPRH